MQQQACSLCGEDRDTDRLVFLTVPSSVGVTVRDTKASFCHLCIVSSLQALGNPLEPAEALGSASCSLCGKSPNEVERMFAGPKGSICKACAISLNAILGDSQG
jgi:ClpX C4-type zinc finger